MAKADAMDFRTLDELKKAGLAGIKYGIESGVQEIVNNSCKSLNLSIVKDIVKYTKKNRHSMSISFYIRIAWRNKRYNREDH